MSHHAPSGSAVTQRRDRANPARSNERDDRDAFASVVNDYRRQVMSVAYRITRNIDDARDVAQHVFMQMYVKGPNLADRRSVDRWLYVVTRNEALSITRKQQRDDAAQASASSDEPQLGLEDTVLRNELDQEVRATIACLPADQRNMIELRHLQSVPSNEIALELGIPVKRVKHDVERAKARLRVEMRRRGLHMQAG